MIAPETFYFKGGDKAVLLLHTFSSSPIDVHAFGEDLHEAGYTVFAPLFSGHGTEDPEDVITAGNPAIWWQDAMTAYQQLQQNGYQQITVFGESLGGIFALKLMEIFPEISGGGTISSPLFPTDKTQVNRTFVARSERWLKRQKLLESEIVKRVNWMREHITTQQDAISAYADGVRDDLASIKQPVFIAEGTADELIDPKVNEKLAETLQATTSVTLKQYEGAPHVITYSKYRHELTQDVLAFLAKLG
ncbi:lipase/esterase [Secundilactobacillus oryzae JCM 18671]|uniref:Lipase/esterase n=1 Tax=Secundilactobacillus oryzae JCM 18671 TaxID=1291743 RepID=A0A081BGA0_9LACO|nr:alpha/beta fold hydrolase [Secundilactobacillus oryzae]GAK47068.1 lipase/esterase [Secundilactobacillus oryzae JCM 18671]